MKPVYYLTAPTLSLLALTSSAFGQQAKIEGHVYDHNNRRVASVRIVATPGGQAGRTDSRGHFTINLPSHVQPGQAAQIRVEKRGWVVLSPMFGVCTTQSSARNVEPLRVVIVPRGSAASLTPKRLGEVVEGLQRQITKLTSAALTQNRKLTAFERRLAKYAFLEEYAKEYGLPEDKLRASLDEWSRIRKSDDRLQRAYKEYYKENFEVVTELTGEAWQDYLRQLELDNTRRLESSRNIIKNNTLGGSAFYEQFKFREALATFEQLEQLFDQRKIAKEDFTKEWADLKIHIGNTKIDLGKRVAGADGPRLLNEALAAYEAVQPVFSRAQSPEEWVGGQVGRANALLNLGQRSAGAKGVEYLKGAEAAYRAALEVRTRERLPQEWALTQNNLGIVLTELGRRFEGAEGIKYLKAAEAAYLTLLAVRTFQNAPQEWAMTRNNLGVTLRELGVRVEGNYSEGYLRKAEAAHRDTLKVKTRKLWPQDWALAQDNLGIALRELGKRTETPDGFKYLEEAEAAHRAALEVRTRGELPQLWASSLGNLGDTLSTQGERKDGAESLTDFQEAAASYRSALEVFTREVWPRDWALGQNNLGALLNAMGSRTKGVAGVQYLKEAEATLTAALEIFPRKYSPQQWAMIQNNLGIVLFNLLRRVGGAEGIGYLNRSVTVLRAAAEVYPRDQLPQQWALIQNNLGNALLLSGQLRLGTPEAFKYLKEAEAAYRAALEVRTKEKLGPQWGLTQANLGSLYYLRGEWEKASEAYINALQFYPNNAEVHVGAVRINHELLFRFEQAFDLHLRWAERHGDDLSAQADFAEAHFTTGRFSESQRRIATILALPEGPEVPASSRVALRAIEIAGLLALEQSGQVSGKLDALIEEVSRQPAAFTIDWSFKGTRHFIDNSERLASHRSWLGKLLDALASEDRDSMLKALQEVKAESKH